MNKQTKKKLICLHQKTIKKRKKEMTWKEWYRENREKVNL